MISRSLFPPCSQICPRVVELEQEIKELEEKLAIQKAENERLRKELRKYKNPHTPPSRRLGSSRSKGRTSRGKPGRRKGHKGVTRPRAEPQETIVVAQKECPHCGSELQDPEAVETRVIEDIPEPQPLEVTEYKIGHYFCESCGEDVIASDSNLPPEGNLGYNVIV